MSTDTDKADKLDVAYVIANLFSEMAARIEHNAKYGFGGAFLIVPPANGGDAIDTLILDALQDPAQFWLLLKTKCDIQIQKIDNAQRQANFRR